MTPDLPDLEAATDTDIVKENLHAVQAIYFAYMLEEMRLFQVVERIVELFGRGLLPLGRGRAADALYRYARGGERMTAQERASFYARALGAPGGSAIAGQPNREFLSLWMRFMVAVSMFARQQSVSRPAAADTNGDGHRGRGARCGARARSQRVCVRRRDSAACSPPAVGARAADGRPAGRAGTAAGFRRARHVAGDRSGEPQRAGRCTQRGALSDTGGSRPSRTGLAGSARGATGLVAG